MTQSDFGEFSQEMRRLATVFRLKASPAEINQIIDAYFTALQHFTVVQIIAATDGWIAKEAKFPRPAELRSYVPKRTLEIPVLVDADAREWLRAEQQRWEDAPCACALCREAGVEEKPLRFVPEQDANDRDRQVKIGDRIVVAGHWAHGFELSGYYRAKANFYNRCLELGFRRDVLIPRSQRKKLTLQERLDRIFWKAQKETPPEAQP